MTMTKVTAAFVAASMLIAAPAAFAQAGGSASGAAAVGAAGGDMAPGAAPGPAGRPATGTGRSNTTGSMKGTPSDPGMQSGAETSDYHAPKR